MQKELIKEQVTIKEFGDVWVIDLKENDLPSDTAKLKQMFIGTEEEYLGYKFKIEDVEFFKYVKDNIVLIANQI